MVFIIIGTQLKLEDGSDGYINQTGRVSVNQYGIWGRICPSTWDDVDADIVCKQLGHRGRYLLTSMISGEGFVLVHWMMLMLILCVNS